MFQCVFSKCRVACVDVLHSMSLNSHHANNLCLTAGWCAAPAILSVVCIKIYDLCPGATLLPFWIIGWSRGRRPDRDLVRISLYQLDESRHWPRLQRVPNPIKIQCFWFTFSSVNLLLRMRFMDWCTMQRSIQLHSITQRSTAIDDMQWLLC